MPIPLIAEIVPQGSTYALLDDKAYYIFVIQVQCKYCTCFSWLQNSYITFMLTGLKVYSYFIKKFSEISIKFSLI